MRSAVLRAHAFGVKVYLTLNTLVTDRELFAFVDTARDALRAGVDALIVADLGGAAAIRRAIPGVELHASTQTSAHNAAAGKLLGDLGYTRMVIARETSAEDMKTVVQNSPIEVEVFIHGALCVSHSGQCLFSSVVGGRSGNRGECAQPCRLPYACPKNRNAYPLSLKDLSLAEHVPFLIDAGVSSLKIEGRMKSPEYVRDTARIWRRLLNERRGATPAEMRSLSETFSRGGFTDGYFTRRVDRTMLGVRSEADKSNSRALEPFAGLTKKLPLTVSASFRADQPCVLSLSDGTRRVTVTGDVPMTAVNAPLTRETVERNLSKLGGTVYEIGDFTLELDGGLMLPISRLNDLRRRAIQALENEYVPSELKENAYVPKNPSQQRGNTRSASFRSRGQITPLARDYFDRIYLPLADYEGVADGVVMPSVIFDRDTQKVSRMLDEAAEKGAKYALVGNLGHLAYVRRAGLIPVGDHRLNATNRETLAALEELGLDEVILSPELTLPQIRDIGGGASVIVYGRLPLMTLEKCAIREISDCSRCSSDRVTLRDRRGVDFPILREWEHRNVICNSLPTCMSDREESLVRASVTARHFLFTVESPDEVDAVIVAHRNRTPIAGQVRRI